MYWQIRQPFFKKKMFVLLHALGNVYEAQCFQTCYDVADAHLKWREDMKHPFVVIFPRIRLWSSTLVEGLGRKLHVPHLQSQR